MNLVNLKENNKSTICRSNKIINTTNKDLSISGAQLLSPSVKDSNTSDLSDNIKKDTSDPLDNVKKDTIVPPDNVKKDTIVPPDNVKKDTIVPPDNVKKDKSVSSDSTEPIKKIPKKRGRKPKKKGNEPPKIPKKRGRKPKPKPLNEPPKIPKKRGRKPKPKPLNEPPKIPKKRGRKPKDKVYSVKSLNNFKLNDDTTDTIILHLPIHSHEIEPDSVNNNVIKYDPNLQIPEPYENNMHSKNYSELETKKHDVSGNDLNNNFAKFEANINNKFNNDLNKNNIIEQTNIIKSNNAFKEDESNHSDINSKKLINIQYEFLDSNSRKVWPKNTNIYCMWCCHPFDGIPCAIPERYLENIFHVFGNFCSFNCCASHIFDKNDNKKWERYSLLNLMYKKISDNKYKKIPMAPPRETLEIFGGHLSIDEYRENNLLGDKVFKIIDPPLISIIPKIEETIVKTGHNKNDKIFIPLDNEMVNKAKKSLRLKREKPITNPNTTLYSYMDLKIV